MVLARVLPLLPERHTGTLLIVYLWLMSELLYVMTPFVKIEDKALVSNLLERVVKLTQIFPHVYREHFPWNFISYKCDLLSSKDLNETKSQFGHGYSMKENSLPHFSSISRIFIIPLLLWIMRELCLLITMEKGEHTC